VSAASTRRVTRARAVWPLGRCLLLSLLLLLAGGGAPARAQMAAPTSERPPSEQLEAGKLSKIPKQTKFVEAEYPKEALDKGITTDVMLLLDINAQGKIDSVGIAEPVNPPGMGFEEAAMVAAQQFEFEPAEVDGKPIAVQITYRYHFKLAPKAPPAPPALAAPATPAGGAPPAATRPAAGAPPVPARKPVVNLSGLLRERGTRLPLPGVLVTVFRDDGETPVGFEAPADAAGAFHFLDLAPGVWKILVEAPGYYPFRTTEEIHAGEATAVTYYVEKGSYNPYDVTVTATRPRKEVSRTIISAAEIDKIPGTAGDPIAVVQNFAGVARAPLLSGQIIVRGSAPEDTRIFVDGSEIPLIYHFGGLRSVIPIGLIDSLEFYPGNFSPTYGRATGGIVDVQVKRLQPKKVDGYVDVSILDTSVFLEAPLGDKGGVAIAARRSYLDFILNAVVPSDANVSLTVAPRYYDYQLVANYRPTPAHDLRAFFLGSDDRFEVLFKDPADLSTQLSANAFSQSNTFYRALLTYRYIPSDAFDNLAQVSLGRNNVNVNAGTQLTFDLDIFSTQFRDTLHRKLSDRATLALGIDTLYGKTTGLVRLPPPPKEGQPPSTFDLGQTMETRISGRAYWSPAIFGELEWKPVPGLLLLPGARLDYFQRVDEFVFQPRLTARYQLSQRVTLKGGVGVFAEEPQFDETDPVFGNPKLKTERALHYSAGVEWKPRPYVTLDATAFYKDLSHLVSPTSAQTVDAAGVSHPLLFDNAGVGRAYGLELVARHDFTHHFTGWLAYTLSRSERRDSGQPDFRLFDFDQTHILTVLGSYTLPRNWQIGGRFRYVTGDPTTPVVGTSSVYNASRDQYDPFYGKVNSARIEPFHQLDLRVDKKWIYQSWILNVYLDIQNVYNRANPEGTAYNYNFRQSQVQQGLPILPILGIRADF
jgi:TonB family protein